MPRLVGYSLVVCVALGPESGQACMLSKALGMFLNEILSWLVPTRQTLAIECLYVKKKLNYGQPTKHTRFDEAKRLPACIQGKHFIIKRAEGNNRQVCAYLDLIVLLVLPAEDCKVSTHRQRVKS